MALPPTAPVELMRKELPFPEYVDNIVLAGAATAVTKPAGVSWVLISPTDTVYIRTSSATVPGANVVDGTGSFPIMPGDPIEARLFNVRGIAAFSIIGTAIVGLAWFRDQTDGLV